MNSRTLPPVSSRGLSRRRWPRFEVNGNLSAQVAALDLVMPVRDVSLGGFAVEAPLRFALGEVHEFLLCRGGDAPRRIRARAAYSHPKRDRDHHYITGWEALGDPDTARAMANLVDRVLALQAEGTEAEVAAPGVHAGSTRRT